MASLATPKFGGVGYGAMIFTKTNGSGDGEAIDPGPRWKKCLQKTAFWQYKGPVPPWKTNMSPEKWWLEDVFPIEIGPF